MIEAIPASNDVNLPGLATTETLTRHVNLNYFSEAVSWEGEERLADADSWRITGNPEVMDQVGRRCPVRGNAVRRLFGMPLGCSTASPRSQRKQLMAGDKNYVLGDHPEAVN